MAANKQVLPAILTDKADELGKLVRAAESFAPAAQFDVMDGEFVPSRSVTCAQIGALKPKLNWEAHLMVRRPEDYLQDFKQAGARKIVFHFEATTTPEKVIQAIRKLGMQAGLAVNPETPIAAFAPLVNLVDSVLFLSVNPGFYGARFIPEVLEKIVAFRLAYPGKTTGIDGGVKESNIVEIARTGVDIICVGSAIFLAPNPAAAYRRLTALVNTGA